MYSEVKEPVATNAVSAPQHNRSGTMREPSQSTRGAALAETEKVAIQAIRQAGRALHTRELLIVMEAAGVEVGGQDPASTLSARLSRAPRLWNDRPNGWRVSDETAPPKLVVGPNVVLPQGGDVDQRLIDNHLAELLYAPTKSARTWEDVVSSALPPLSPQNNALVAGAASVPPMPSYTGGLDDDDYS